MAKRKLSLWLGLVGSGLLIIAGSCYSASHDGRAAIPVGSKADELIGGFGANSSALNAVGSLTIQYSWRWQSSCTATLVTEDMVLTARQCAEQLAYDYGARAWFAIGPNAQAPTRQVEVIHYELAPVDPQSNTQYNIAVLHLEEPISDVTPLPWAAIDGNAIGQTFASIGYGVQNTTYTTGTRRVGGLTLRAMSGPLNASVFGSFEAYFKWSTGADLPTDCGNFEDDAGVPLPVGGKGGMGGSAGKGGCGGSGGKGGAVSCRSPEDYLCQQAVWLRQAYENERLEDAARVHAGGLPGDAQPCWGDEGSPLLRKDAADQVTVYAVMSGGYSSNKPDIACDHGAIYSAFDKTVLEFLEQAKAWVDPCGSLSTSGRCSGTLAERCSGFGEGERRSLSFDCASVGLSCEIQNDGGVGCGKDDSYFRPEPPTKPDATPDLRSQVFRSPGLP